MKSKWDGFKSSIAVFVEDFLAYKRALGNRFDTEESALRMFDRFLTQREVHNLSEITGDLLDDFLLSRPRFQPRSYNHLLGVLRRLFDWMVRQGYMKRSPLIDRLRRTSGQRLPFLFDISQIRRLLKLAERLPDNNRAKRRGNTYKTIFTLLYGLGLRVGEVSRLCVSDIDFNRNILTIRNTKFGKSRLVPFGPKIGELLKNYLKDNHPLKTETGICQLFSFTPGRPIHPCTISQVFHSLIPELKLNIPQGVIPPCVHHLRHSFAVGTLLRWYRQGVNPMQRLLHLSTFMGHVNPESTMVYLTITDELLREANERFERFFTGFTREVHFTQ